MSSLKLLFKMSDKSESAGKLPTTSLIIDELPLDNPNTSRLPRRAAFEDSGTRRVHEETNEIDPNATVTLKTLQDLMSGTTVPEQPSALIPVFSQPVSSWARHITNILKSKGYNDNDLKDVKTSQNFMGTVLAKLPHEIARHCPTKTCLIC